MKRLFPDTPPPDDLYRMLVDNARDALVAIDADGRIVEWNAEAERAFGWSRVEILGVPLGDTIAAPVSVAMNASSLSLDLLSGKTAMPGASSAPDLVIRRRDGSWLTVALVVVPVEMAGTTVHFALLRTPSDRAVPAETASGTTALASMVLDNMSAAVVLTDAAGNVILANPAARGLLGSVTAGEALSALPLLQADRRTAYPEQERPLRRALDGHVVNGMLGYMPGSGDGEGTWLRIDALPLRDEAANLTGAIVVLHDVSRSVRAERALRHGLDEAQLMLEGITDYGIMMLDAEGFIISWNPGAERIFARDAASVIGTHSAELFTDEDRGVGEPVRELREARERGRSENNRWHVRADGSRFWATGTVMPLWRDDGSLHGFAKVLRDQTAERLADEQTRFLASHDALTGLANRVSFSNQLHNAMAQTQRTGVPFALLLLDLDRFKYVNDTFGHHAGDLLLKEVALRIVSSIRETDFVARLGGDEFVVIQADASQPQSAETLARKLVLELGRPFQLEGQEVQSGASIGISTYPADAGSSVELLKRADLALYRAKHAGRHTYQLYNGMTRAEQGWKRDREAALRAALKNQQFELYYQPQVDLGNWRVATVEALLRWNASELETVLPADFLSIAEQTGMIVEIGEWALREAAHQVRRWQSQGLSELRLSVNCSARQFSDARFVAMIPAILADAGMAPSSLALEVPESMLARHPAIKEQLAALRALGIRLMIDNFGTGATALRDFQDFAIDALKIDKAFVEHLPHRREDSAITSAIISLAHNLGIEVVAGGVETAEQLAYLKSRACDGAQGFIFSPPVPAERFEQLVKSGHWSRINPTTGVPDAGFNKLH
ncbi:MAG TPA: EAL domain-containing protein [Noviherbaspirillum sp.]|jgi:diguanylate cyclase (GGDEF)-like protein/PAS domain S-box-containing protein|uniref:sensor domain-containing protein n=1 Tax=Noviherbaspirillum sp. TaxID=1926288 RepID=UPI002F95871D